ncbi:hypothetical protein Bca52824_060158 [Brassica carinata]|uniref:Uncharacterized protein n=1 Tax=Brassica carinata TaxID=52824 RepID=A0A8X7QY06_BRACI|nr:hypothetical protein Bca52824_060158 [Brassica carinata]
MSGSGPTSPFTDGGTYFEVSDPPKLLSRDRLRCSKTDTTPKEQKIAVSSDLDADHVIRCASTSSNQEAAQQSSLGSYKEFDFGTDEKHLTVDDEHRAYQEEQRLVRPCDAVRYPYSSPHLI